jgi:hypothetical protein
MDKEGFYWPSSVIKSKEFVSFLKRAMFKLWFRFSSNIVRSDEMKDPVTKKLYKFYKKDKLLVAYFPQKVLADRLKVDVRTINRFKKELIEDGFMTTRKFTWSGKHIDCYVLGEIRDGKEVNYAFEKCKPGYSKQNNNWWVWENKFFKLPEFEEFMDDPAFILWFHSYTTVLRGATDSALTNYIRKTFYVEKKLLPAYYQDKVLADRLGVSPRAILKWKKRLIALGYVQAETIIFSRHHRKVLLLGEYMKNDKSFDNEALFIFKKLEPEKPEEQRPEVKEYNTGGWSTFFEMEKGLDTIRQIM